ncbi:MAG: 16S rRNA methyltransferase [Thermoprotei archaeon]|nr:16S rRNA methyltransferase [Thermoprotei archaeon]
MLYLLIAEAALELIPSEVWGHPAIRKYAMKRGKHPSKLLLDISFHYSAVKNLPHIEKRGRPDIVHITLLEALGSPLNRSGKLRVYVHTFRNYIIEVNPETRLPRNYYRFVGLMEQLFERRRVPPRGDKVLLRIKKGSIRDVVGEIAPTEVIIMSEKGEAVSLNKLAETLTSTPKPLVIIGGFQRGDFTDETLSLANLKVSLYPEPLDAWVVVSRVITAYEEGIGLYERSWRASENT